MVVTIANDYNLVAWRYPLTTPRGGEEQAAGPFDAIPSAGGMECIWLVRVPAFLQAHIIFSTAAAAAERAADMPTFAHRALKSRRADS